MNSNSDRVAKSINKKIKLGGRRLPPYVLSVTDAAALAHLERGDFGTSTMQCLTRAIREAAQREGWVPEASGDPPQ